MSTWSMSASSSHYLFICKNLLLPGIGYWSGLIIFAYHLNSCMFQTYIFYNYVILHSFSSGGEDGYVRLHHFDPDYFTIKMWARNMRYAGSILVLEFVIYIFHYCCIDQYVLFYNLWVMQPIPVLWRNFEGGFCCWTSISCRRIWTSTFIMCHCSIL